MPVGERWPSICVPCIEPRLIRRSLPNSPRPKIASSKIYQAVLPLTALEIFKMCDNKTLTQEVAEKITDGQNLDINEFTAMDDAAAKGLSKHERRLGHFLMASDNPLDDITDTFSNGGHPLPPDPVDVLRQHSEQVPDWLRPGIHADRRLLRRFLNSERISFYPGAGLDVGWILVFRFQVLQRSWCHHL